MARSTGESQVLPFPDAPSFRLDMSSSDRVPQRRTPPRPPGREAGPLAGFRRASKPALGIPCDLSACASRVREERRFVNQMRVSARPGSRSSGTWGNTVLRAAVGDNRPRRSAFCGEPLRARARAVPGEESRPCDRGRVASRGWEQLLPRASDHSDTPVPAGPAAAEQGLPLVWEPRRNRQSCGRAWSPDG